MNMEGNYRVSQTFGDEDSMESEENLHLLPSILFVVKEGKQQAVQKGLFGKNSQLRPWPVERSTFASCSADGSFKVWDIREKELVTGLKLVTLGLTQMGRDFFIIESQDIRKKWI